MAIPICPKCDNPFFEMNEIEPVGGKFKHTVINCNACGAVVGVMDYYNIGNMLKTIGERLGINL